MNVVSKIIVGISIGLFYIHHSYAGCLDNIATTQTIKSKIKGLYLKSSYSDSKQYVILDKLSCTATAGDVQLGELTKVNYYLQFDKSDNSLLAALLAAQTQNQIVSFRIDPPLDATANVIRYIVTPSP